MKTNDMNHNVKIQFPSILVIPFISVFGIVLKLFGLTQYDWLHVILSVPIAIYFMWCVGYCVLAIVGIVLIKMLKGDDNG